MSPSTRDSIVVRPTPNPDALKFILDRTVKLNGQMVVPSSDMAQGNPMAMALFDIPGIMQLNFNANIITVTKSTGSSWEHLESIVISTIVAHLDSHNPDFSAPDPEKERREKLPPEIRKIEEILDGTIRPYLHGDGGDLQCLKYENNQLLIRYQGACGSCPSAMTGTLYAIISVLREEYNPQIEVYIDPN